MTAYDPLPLVHLTHPEWSKNATIYQINPRQFTPEGTFRAAELQLPRLHDLGVGIVWLMPIHPIGEVNRKGTLGSPYSCLLYTSRPTPSCARYGPNSPAWPTRSSPHRRASANCWPISACTRPWSS